MRKFNDFFMDKEEDEVIQIQALSDDLDGAQSLEELKGVKGRLINLHGELVLVLHWSLINYSAIVKILKKHDKRTGLLLRAPYLANVLQQPFSSTNMMSRLVKRAEELVSKASERTNAAAVARGGDAAAATGPSAAGPHRAAGGAAAAQADGATSTDTTVTTSTGGDAAGGGAVAAAGAAAATSLSVGVAAVGVDGVLEDPAAALAAAADVSSGEDSDTSAMNASHLQGPIAKRAQLVLEMWNSLAKTASTPSTVLPTAQLAQAGLIRLPPPGAPGAAAAAAETAESAAAAATRQPAAVGEPDAKKIKTG